MIIWSGRGILPALLLVGVFIMGIKILPEGISDYAATLAFFVTSAFSWHFGKKWNRTRKTLVDEKTGKRYAIKSNHSLFFIKMQYWGIIFLLLGLFVFQLETGREGGHTQNTRLINYMIWLVIGMYLFITLWKTQKKKTIKRKMQIDMKKPIREKVHTEELKKEVYEEERQKLIINREDHSRFMPKGNP